MRFDGTRMRYVQHHAAREQRIVMRGDTYYAYAAYHHAAASGKDRGERERRL